ncbi:putative oxysterol-binding protein [Helianthus annuus]|nr:putative oxysterol-binding protein [Helianthus annuus]
MLQRETYEADYPEKGVRFFSEKVSHHPTLIACHCEGRGWKFYGDSNIRTQILGEIDSADPVGLLTPNLTMARFFNGVRSPPAFITFILGKVYCDHHGLMHIRGNRSYLASSGLKNSLFSKEILVRYMGTLKIQTKLPPTDSRLRPDQRHLENGEYDMANAEKLRLETRQRMVDIGKKEMRRIGKIARIYW